MSKLILIMASVGTVFLLTACQAEQDVTEVITTESAPPSFMPSVPPSTPTLLPTSEKEPSPTSTVDIFVGLGYIPEYEVGKCAFEVPSWLDGECGTLTLLEDRRHPEGNIIKIPVVIFRSLNPNPQPDPVIYLTGGGGGNELDNIERYNSVILNVIQNRDYIMYNQRGAKYSVPYLQCPGMSDFHAELVEQQLTDREYEERELAFLQKCSEDLRAKGIDLNMYNSAVNATDLNDLRLALGYNQINIYGTSYGTRLALAAIRDYPEMIRSAIIDSVYPPQVDFFSEYAINTYHAFGRVFDACYATDDCRETYPDPESLLYQVMDELNAQPQSMRYAGQTLYYDGHDLLDAFYLYPYAHQAGVLPAAIYAASQGDYSYAEQLMPFTLGVVHSETIAEGVQNSMLCREEVPYESYDRLVELGLSIPSHYFEPFNTDFYWRMCEIWGVDPADEFVNQPVVSDVPTLVLEGLYDPITPIEWGKLAAETLSKSYYYEFPGGHGIMRTYNCGLTIGLQFIDDPWTAPDATCIQSMSPPDF